MYLLGKIPYDRVFFWGIFDAKGFVLFVLFSISFVGLSGFLATES